METLPSHLLTTLVGVTGAMSPPFLVYFTYRASGATQKKSVGLAGAVGVWGIALYWLCRFGQHGMDPTLLWGLLFANLFGSSAVVWLFRGFLVGDGLSLPWLLVPQAFRYMGGLFLLENYRGHVGAAFAYPAGLGDIMAAVIATTLLIQLLSGGRVTKQAYYWLIAFGAADFISAYTFSCLSTDGIAFQVFALDEPHRVALFPLGMIPFYLAPFAMAYHWLMFFTVRNEPAREDHAPVFGGV